MSRFRALCLGLLFLTSPVFTQNANCSHVEALAERTYFYVGGSIVNATFPPNPPGEYLVGQMYVERLTPKTVKHETPIVFIHGLAQTATNWLNTPDNREGWASYFLRQGYVIYLTDQPERGRSPWLPGSGSLAVLARDPAWSLFTAPEKVQPLPYPQAKLHTQWPGTGLPGDPIFDTFYATQVAYQNNATRQAQLNNASYIALVEQIGTPVALVTHSQAGPFGWQLGDARPELVAGIVAIEPGATPFETWTGPPFAPGYFPKFPPNPYGIAALPLRYEPPLPGDDPSELRRERHPAVREDRAPCILQAEPARRLVSLAKVPILQIVGEASFQAVYSGCVARYLKQAGVPVNFTRLEDVGIHGNGHFSFSEKNNIEVAERVVVPFLEKIEN